MTMITQVGLSAQEWWRELRYLAAVTWSVLSKSVRPRYWNRTARAELSRQILSSGVESTWLIARVALAVGISVVAQALVWLNKIGQSKLLGPLLVTVLVRETVPVITNLLVIGRNGIAYTAELANMKISEEVRVLDAQGLDPFIYLVVPRVLCLTVAVLCLGVVFIFISFATGYLCGLLLNPNIGDPSTFVQTILNSLEPADVINFLAKSVIPALLTGAICCVEGLRVGSAVTEVPAATKRALTRSVGFIFFISALVSLLTYL